MSLFQIYPQTIRYIKLILVTSLALCSACGLRTPGGYTLGTTSIHAVYVEQPLDCHTEEDKRQLQAVIAKRRF